MEDKYFMANQQSINGNHFFIQITHKNLLIKKRKVKTWSED
jgi:hypothetical protein